MNKAQHILYRITQEHANLVRKGVKIVQAPFQRFNRPARVEAAVATGPEQLPHLLVHERLFQFIGSIDVDQRFALGDLQDRHCHAPGLQLVAQLDKLLAEVFTHGMVKQVAQLQPRQCRRSMVDDRAFQHNMTSLKVSVI